MLPPFVATIMGGSGRWLRATTPAADPGAAAAKAILCWYWFVGTETIFSLSCSLRAFLYKACLLLSFKALLVFFSASGMVKR